MDITTKISRKKSYSQENDIGSEMENLMPKQKRSIQNRDLISNICREILGSKEGLPINQSSLDLPQYSKRVSTQIYALLYYLLTE